MSTVRVPSSVGDALPGELERVFREHSRIIYRTAFHVTGSHQDAEDVLQTIFLRLLRTDLPRDV
jgi:DNA-directed RNA polymerase specialized sigma24 family protein